MIACARCGTTAEPPTRVTWGGQLGDEIRARTCAACWSEWEEVEVKVINELKLNFMDPESQNILTRHLREFLMLDAAS
jgi:Fe-S cluster biosynthesis and repair protein YggX